MKKPDYKVAYVQLVSARRVAWPAVPWLGGRGGCWCSRCHPGAQGGREGQDPKARYTPC